MSKLQQLEDEIPYESIDNSGQLKSYSEVERMPFEIYATNKLQQNRDKIDTLYQRFTGSINEYMKNYVQYNLDTTSYDKYNIFINNRVEVDSLTKIMQTLSYEIQNDTVTLNKNMSGVKTLIKNEKIKQQKLIKQESYDIPVDNSSSLMISNSVENYKSQYISNWIMFIGIIIISICLVKMF